MRLMFHGRLITESLRVGADLMVPDIGMTRCGRHDVADTVSASQPKVWTFVDFEVPDHRAGELATAIASVLPPYNGWYADFQSDNEHIVVFADRYFRYTRGDPAARDEVVRYGRAVGTPEHQLDWEAEDLKPSGGMPKGNREES
jgi:hypothetical protein